MIDRPKAMAARGARVLYRRLLHRATTLLVVALLLPVFSAAVQAEQRTLRVGVGSNPPIAFRDSSGAMQGIAVDVLNYVAQQEGWRLEYVHDEWPAIFAMLERGEIDLLTGVAYTLNAPTGFSLPGRPCSATGASPTPSQAARSSRFWLCRTNVSRSSLGRPIATR